MIMPLSLAEEEEWLKNQLKKSPFERPLAIEIQPDSKKDNWVFVGGCGFIDIDWQNRGAEIGIQIGEKEYWDQGYSTKAVRLLLNIGFKNLNLHRLWLRVFESNKRAIRSYEKAGFVVEGKFREAEYLDGKYVDVMIMSVLKSEWQPDLIKGT
jgi:RimJ/RimL family protein N-acetyltransferase